MAEPTKKEIIDKVLEKFVAVAVKTIDAKKRINLGEKILKLINSKRRADAYKVFIGEDGDVLLRPVVAIPSKEAWIYENPKVINQIRKGLSEAKAGKAKKVTDLDKFFQDL